VPALRGIFKFTYLHGRDLLVCVAIGAGSVVWFELLKVANRRRPVRSR